MAQGPAAQTSLRTQLYTVPAKEIKQILRRLPAYRPQQTCVSTNPDQPVRVANEAGAADFWRSGVAELGPGPRGLDGGWLRVARSLSLDAGHFFMRKQLRQENSIPIGPNLRLLLRLGSV